MGSENKNFGNIIRFPVERRLEPPDPIEVFKKAHQTKEEEKKWSIDEPRVLKEKPDSEIIKNFVIEKDKSRFHDYKDYPTPISIQPATYGLVREILNKPPESLKDNPKYFDLVLEYTKFLTSDFIKTIDDDLVGQAELYKYAANLNKDNGIIGDYIAFRDETNSQFHLMSGDKYKAAARAEKDPQKKADLLSEFLNEYDAQIKIYELKKRLSQKDFDLATNPSQEISDKTKNKMATILAKTLKDYDDEIKVLNKHILKIAKIK